MQAKALVEAYFRCSNQRRLEDIDALLHPEIIYISDNTGQHRGRAAVMAMMRRFFAAHPKLHWRVAAQRSEARDAVWVQFVLTGETADGETFSRHGEEWLRTRDGRLVAIEVRNTPGSCSGL